MRFLKKDEDPHSEPDNCFVATVDIPYDAKLMQYRNVLQFFFSSKCCVVTINDSWMLCQLQMLHTQAFHKG